VLLLPLSLLLFKKGEKKKRGVDLVNEIIYV